MIRFAYPNVDEPNGRFLGCGRYQACPSDQVPQGYKVANPDIVNLTKIMTAASQLAPGPSDSIVCEFKDNAALPYRGDSLDLAYFLAVVSCTRRLRWDRTSELHDIWCTGVIDIVDGKRPFLNAVKQRGFDLKLEAFLSKSNRDTFFIVPLPNITSKCRSLCAEKNARVISVSEFQTLEIPHHEISTNKIVVAVNGYELDLLIHTFFEISNIKLNYNLNLIRLKWQQAFQILSIFILFTLIYIFYSSSNVVLPTWISLLFLLFAIWCCRNLLNFIRDIFVRISKPMFPRGHIFRGIFRYDENVLRENSVIFDRSKEADSLFKTIVDQKKAILAVTGESGVGKSILVKLLDKKIREEGNEHISFFLGRFNSPYKTDLDIIDDTIEFIRKNESFLSNSSDDDLHNVIVVLDQFETCLDEIINSYLGKIDNVSSLRSFLENSQQHSNGIVRGIGNLFLLKKDYDNLKVVVVLRSDRYYDLRILGKLGQIPYDAFEVQGVAGRGKNTLMDALYKIRFKFKDAEKLIEDLKEPDGTILPVKIQIIGCMLERMVFYPPRYGVIARLFSRYRERLLFPRTELTLRKYQDLGGAAGLIERYFRIIMQSSPSVDIARELLFVLGIEGRVKTRYTLSELSAVIFREEDNIQETINYLVKEGLLTVCHGKYAFVHDYLAQCYNQLSGRLIAPVVRDNLAYSHTTLIEGKKLLSLEGRAGVDVGNCTKYVLFAAKVFMLMFFGYRLLNFEAFPLESSIGWIGLPFLPGMGLPFAKYKVLANWYIDWHYLPIGLAQCCWGLYVVGLVSNVFFHIDHTKLMKLWSFSLVVFTLIGLIWTAFIPGLWLVWIGINGMLVGSKFAHLGYKLYKLTSGRNRFSIIGFYTLINSFFAIYVGSLIFPYISWDLPGSGNKTLTSYITDFLSLSSDISFFSVYYACVPVFVYFVYMYRAHVLPSRAVEFIGLYKRVETI